MEKVKEILSKESLNEQDVKFLVAHKESLEQKDLERLGLVPTTPVLVVEEPVVERTLPSGTVMVANEIKEQQNLPPKKRGRQAKI